jgi:hypothetical protein
VTSSPHSPATPRVSWYVPLLLFALVYTVYVTSKVRIQTDSIWSIPTAASLLHEGNTNLDEFRETFTTYTRHGVREHEGHAYYEYPMGAVLAALPFLAGFEALVSLLDPLLPHLGRLGQDWLEWHRAFNSTGNIDLGFYNRTEQRIASFYVAAAAVLVFLTARRRASMKVALTVALLFALGTTAYSTASRALWQHAPSLLTTASVVYLLTGPAQTSRTALLTGLVVALSYVCRPTNSLTVMVVTALYVLRWRRLLPAYFGGAALVAVPFCAYNLAIYGSLFAPYYIQPLDPTGGHFLEALVGHLISPSRGLFIYSPILLLSVVGMVGAVRRRTLTAPQVAFLAILLLHWLAVSAFPVWWAGHSVGPRFFTDVLPYLAWFLHEPVASALEAPRQRPILAAALGVLAAVSITFHWKGATAPGVHMWNAGPPDVDEAPARAWDWSDPQFLRGLREPRQ